MAVTFDAAASAATASGGATSITFAHTCTGTNLVLLVFVGLRQTAGETVSGITYNSVALTFIGAVTNAGNSRCEVWGLASPATGAHNVVVTLSASIDAGAASASFTGAATSVSGFVGATAGSTTPQVIVTSAATSIVADGVVGSEGSGATLTAGAGQTKQSDVASGAGAGNAHVGQSTEAGGASVSMDWTLGRSNQWAQVGVSIDQYVAPAGGARQLAATGVGT